jgi:hypothetical protein
MVTTGWRLAGLVDEIPNFRPYIAVAIPQYILVLFNHARSLSASTLASSIRFLYSILKPVL